MDDDLRPTIHLPLDGLKLSKTIEGESKWILALYRSDGRPVVENYDELKLICQSIDDFNLSETFLLSAIDGCVSSKQIFSNYNFVFLFLI